MTNLNADELEAGLPEVLASPKDDGEVKMIVRRPDVDRREVLDAGDLDVTEGLVGDNWRSRGSRQTNDGSAHPEMQLNLMNSRVVALVAQSEDRWALAGDQFFVDLDLGRENLPAGTRLAMGSAILEVTRAEGIDVCPEGAATFAGMRALIEGGRLDADSRIVLFNTGTGLKHPELRVTS